MRRRKFLKVASGLLVPVAFPSILTAAVPPGRRAPFFSTPLASGGGGGPNVWYDTRLNTDTDSQPSSSVDALEWSPVVVTTGGSCTKGRIYMHGGGAAGTYNLKMGLYSAKFSDSIRASGSRTVTLPGDGDSYLEVTWGAPFTVSNSTTYYVAWITDTVEFFWEYKSGSDTWLAKIGYGYANFPGAEPASADFELARGYAVGIWVQ